MYDLNMLNRETNVIMSGTYVTGKNKNIKIDVGQVLNLSLLSPYTSSDIDKMNLQAQIVTNNIYNLNDENKEFFRRNTNHDCYDCNIVNVGMDEWCSDNS